MKIFSFIRNHLAEFAAVIVVACLVLPFASTMLHYVDRPSWFRQWSDHDGIKFVSVEKGWHVSPPLGKWSVYPKLDQTTIHYAFYFNGELVHQKLTVEYTLMPTARTPRLPDLQNTIQQSLREYCRINIPDMTDERDFVRPWEVYAAKIVPAMRHDYYLNSYGVSVSHITIETLNK